MIITYKIPENYFPLVKNDDEIDFQTYIFEKKINQEKEINLAQILNIKPKNIFRTLRKFVGDKIKKNDLIAENKTFFSTIRFLSPDDGLIKEIDHVKGSIIIETESNEKNKILSFIKGKVEKIDKNTIKIKIKNGESFPIKKSTTDFGGEIFYLENNNDFNFDQINNKIILTEKINSYFQAKIEALGAKGFVILENLPEKTDLPVVMIKNTSDFKKIKKSNHPYCTIISQSDMIYFYQ